MIELDSLLKKEGAPVAPVAAVAAVVAALAANLAALPVESSSAPDPSANPVPKPPPIQIPPGLPQEYVDINLQEQPVPPPLSEDIAQAQTKPLSHELTPGVATMCHRECISYRPGPETRLTQDRIDQGPRTFVSLAQKAAFEREQHEEKPKEPRGPSLSQPDTFRAGTHIKGESASYRPGA